MRATKKIIMMGEAEAPKKNLIVNDEPTILLTLSHALRSKDEEVITASRLVPAEEALKRHTFDLVITEIRMSGMLGENGLELRTCIKRNLPWTKITIKSPSCKRLATRRSGGLPMNAARLITI